MDLPIVFRQVEPNAMRSNPLPHLALTTALLAAFGLPGVAWGKEQPTPAQIKADAAKTFESAQLNMRDAQEREQRAKKARTDKCEAAEAADSRLMNTKPDAPEFSELTQKALAQERLCELARESFEAASRLYGVTRNLLREIATDLSACGTSQARCAAQDQAPLVDRLAARRKSGDIDALANSALIEAAAKSQTRVAEERGNAKAAYSIQDPLLDSVLAAPASEKPGDRGSEIRQGTTAVLQAVPDLRFAARDAQEAANQLRRNAAELLKPCEREKTKSLVDACTLRQAAERLAAAEALARLDVQLLAAQGAQARLTEGAMQADAAVKYEGEDERRAAIQFAKLLNKYDDARSMLGESSALRFTASGAGGEATLKLGIGRVQAMGTRSATLILTAPTDKDGFTQLSNVDGFSRTASVAFGMSDVHASQTMLPFDALSQTGLAIKFGTRPHSYLKSLNPKDEVTDNHKLWELSIFNAFYRLKVENPSVHIVRLQMQRTLSDDNAETRCPLPAAGASVASITCVSGSFAPLEPDWRTLLSYQLRLQLGKFGFSPQFTYSARKAHRWDVELPVYFWAGHEKDAPLSAGIKLNWTNKPGDGKPKARFGLFVGSTFNFWGSPE